MLKDNNFHQYDYDDNNRLISTDGPWVNDTITFQYDKIGQLKTLTPQSGQVINYNYDPLGRLTTIQSGTNTFTYGYTGVNPIIQSLTRPNGSITEYLYNDPLKRLTEITNKTSVQVIINKHIFTYNNLDLIDTETITTGTALDVFTAGLKTYDYNKVNQLLTSTNPAESFTYDDDGNMTQGYTPEGYVFTATYDAENRLKAIEYTDGGSVVHRTEHFYSGDSMLAQVKKFENSILVSDTRFVKAGFLPIQERDGSNYLTREYTWGLNMGGGIGGLLNLKQSGSDYSYLYDGKGNVSALIDDSQNVVASYRYDIFGKLLKKVATLDQPYRFSTKQYDEQMGQYDFGFRFYSPAISRWISRDPLGETGGINLYGFIGNNPVNFVDPLGLDGIYVGYSGYPVNTGYGFTLPLGHGAVVAVNPKTGTSKYFEYGRYDSNFGQVKQRTVPDLVMKDGTPTADSLANLYKYISQHYGKNSPVDAIYYPDADYQKLIDFALERMRDKNRDPYSIWNNNCKTFGRDAINAGRN